MRLRRIAALLLAACLGACGEPKLVDDRADLFDAGEKERLAQYHGYLLLDHDIDYRVVTSGALPDINRQANETFSALGVGGESTTGRGLLLLIDADRNRVRLEVSYGLEGIFPDAFVAYVEARQMIPFFRAQRVADGILATSELIIDRVQRAKAGGAFEAEIGMAGSGGAGATMPAEIGRAAPTVEPRRQSRRGAGRSPSRTLALYLDAMDARNADPDLPIYTADTQRMLADWVVTAAQMDNLVKAYRRCGSPDERRDASGRLAVIRYPIEDRACAPFFFRREGEAWLLDLTMMRTAVRFGRDNSWHFQVGVAHPYAFAFGDWRFDGKGFPRKRQ